MPITRRPRTCARFFGAFNDAASNRTVIRRVRFRLRSRGHEPRMVEVPDPLPPSEPTPPEPVPQPVPEPYPPPDEGDPPEPARVPEPGPLGVET